MSINNQELIDKKKIQFERRIYESRKVQVLELFLWTIISFFIGWIWYSNLYNNETVNSLTLINLILISASPLILPILSKIIFGVYPLEFLRQKFQIKSNSSTQESLEVSESEFIRAEIEAEESEDFLVRLTTESDKLSRKLFSRSSSYLFIGSIISLIGIVYFSFQSLEITQKSTVNWETLIHFLPRLGALFFIEFIAFFFLKQYRITMDDFKYYESIKRQRESNLLLYKLYNKSGISSKTEVLNDLIQKLELFKNPTVLTANETTESIETRKYSNEELNILNNIVNQIGNFKG